MNFSRLLYIFFFLLLVSSCKEKAYVWQHQGENKPVENVEKDPEIDLMVKPYQQGLMKEMDEVIGHSSESMMRDKGESTLGNFVADIVFEVGKNFLIEDGKEVADNYIFSYINFGGLRSSISKGEVTVGDIYSLMPFDNEIVVLKLTGKKVQELIDYNLQFGGQPAGNIIFEVNKSDDNYEMKSVVIGNQFFDVEKSYFVVTTDYLAGGGDNMTFFDAPEKQWKTGILLRDAIIQKTKDEEDIYTRLNQRWNESR